MSYVISIRRAASRPPFSREELERVAQSQPGLALEEGAIVWSSSSGRRVELFIGERELRADGVPGGVAEQALAVFAFVAQALNAQLVGEEGEVLAGTPIELAAPAPWWQVAGGALIVVLALPFTLLLVLVRLPWLLWKIGRGVK